MGIWFNLKMVLYLGCLGKSENKVYFDPKPLVARERYRKVYKKLSKISRLNMKTKHIIFLTVGIILILFGSVYTFTRPAFSVGWDLSKTGNIGDTIGGITAPIINIIGSILIFISFLAQNKANKIQANQNNFNLLHQLFRDVKDDYNNLSFSSSSIKDGKIYQGQKALSVFSETLEIRKSN